MDIMQYVKEDVYQKVKGLTDIQKENLMRRVRKYEDVIAKLKNVIEKDGLNDFETEILRLDRSDVVNDVLFCLGEWLADGFWNENYKIEAPDLYWMREMSAEDSFLVYYVISDMIDLCESLVCK